MEWALKDTERIDELNGRGYRIIQDKRGFCFGLDAVLLSSFAIIREGERVLDLCTGSGVIPILLEAKTDGSHFTGIEIQEEVSDMARRSVAMNHLEERVDIVTGDLRNAEEIFGFESFDVVTANPPYFAATGGLTSPNKLKAIARTEIECTLADVVYNAGRVTKSGGRFYMVHRAERLSEIMRLMGANSFAVRYVRFVYPEIEKGANLILVEGVKDARHKPVIEKPCIVYDKPGVYNQEMTDIYFNEKLMEHGV